MRRLHAAFAAAVLGAVLAVSGCSAADVGGAPEAAVTPDGATAAPTEPSGGVDSSAPTAPTEPSLSVPVLTPPTLSEIPPIPPAATRSSTPPADTGSSTASPDGPTASTSGPPAPPTTSSRPTTASAQTSPPHPPATAITTKATTKTSTRTTAAPAPSTVDGSPRPGSPDMTGPGSSPRPATSAACSARSGDGGRDQAICEIKHHTYPTPTSSSCDLDYGDRFLLGSRRQGHPGMPWRHHRERCRGGAALWHVDHLGGTDLHQLGVRHVVRRSGHRPSLQGRVGGLRARLRADRPSDSAHRHRTLPPRPAPDRPATRPDRTEGTDHHAPTSRSHRRRRGPHPLGGMLIDGRRQRGGREQAATSSAPPTSSATGGAGTGTTSALPSLSISIPQSLSSDTASPTQDETTAQSSDTPTATTENRTPETSSTTPTAVTTTVVSTPSTPSTPSTAGTHRRRRRRPTPSPAPPRWTRPTYPGFVTPVGFLMPSGNIGCGFQPTKNPDVVCQIQHHTYPNPKACVDGPTGGAVDLSAGGTAPSPAIRTWRAAARRSATAR